MTQTRLMRRITAWIACIAILLSSLAPSVSHALSAYGAAVQTFHTEICTAAGVKLAHQPSSPDQTHQMDDCPYCRVQSEMPALPPADLLPPLLVDTSLPFPSLFYQAPRPLFAWTSAQPRAPPALL